MVAAVRSFMLNDLRYSLRMLLRNPLVASVATASLALGIGGAASVFTLLNAIVLRDLPVPNPHQLYAADKHRSGDVDNRYSWPLIQQAAQDLQGRAELFAATPPTQMQVRVPNRSDATASERTNVQLVSGGFFEAFRQHAQVGRLIAPHDTAAVGANAVMVISDGYWWRRFQRDPAIIGRELIVGGASLVVIGVAAPEFFGPFLAFRNPDVWIPLTMQADVRYAFNVSMDDQADGTRPWATQPAIAWLSLFARVPDSSNADGVASTLTRLHQRDAGSRLSASDTEGRARLERERVLLTSAGRGVSFLRGDLSSRLFVLLAMVGVLLAITCGNVASLLVARASAREREIAVRTAIGASRWRVVRQLLVETLLIACGGGALGLLVAAWGRDLLLSLFTGSAALIDLDIRFDWRVLLFVVSLTILCGLMAGVLPALRITRVSPTDAIKAQARQVGQGGRRGVLIGKTLVSAQMAFCLLLLVVAGLFVRSMQQLARTDVGFDRDRLLVARMDVRSMGYSNEQRQALYERVLERLRRIPGVNSVSLSLNGPFGNSWRASSLVVEGYTPAADERLMTNEEIVTPDYFETVGLAVVEGRAFSRDDGRPGSRSTIVNQSMARRFFPAGGAVGKRWTTADAVQPDAPVIVGVVGDAKYFDVRGATPNMVYYPSGAMHTDVLGNIEIRTAGVPAALVPTTRQALSELEPALPVYDVVPLDQRVNRGLTNDRLIANLTSTFGIVALLLACLGLYGTISYGVARRIAELGVRMALGASRATIAWLVVREAITLVGIGAALGLPLAFVAGRSILSMLHEVNAVDPTSYSQATVLLLIVAGVAAYLPAHRASRIDPMVALRSE
jgi:predicted permease